MLGKSPLEWINGPWSNTACMGYVILAMKAAGFTPDEVAMVLHAMPDTFDRYSTKEAEDAYFHGGV